MMRPVFFKFKPELPVWLIIQLLLPLRALELPHPGIMPSVSIRLI